MECTATNRNSAGLALYLAMVLGMLFMAGVTATVAMRGDWVGWPFAVVFATLAILTGWFARSHAVEPLTEWWWSLARFAKRHWPVALVYAVMAGLALLALYLVINFLTWVFTESPQQQAHREATERYYVWKNALSVHVDMCTKKNGKDHFGPMLGFAGIGSGRCGDFGRSNGVACTSDNRFQENLKVMWDEAKARNACVVWEPSRVTWRGADRFYRGVSAHADDGVGNSIYIAFKEKKLQ